jgi:outer membrane protein OmpA-like peptidoglycan-associated protein
MVLGQKGKRLESFSGGQGSPIGDRIWGIDRRGIDTAVAPIDVDLTLHDLAEGSASAHASVPLLLQMNRQVVESRHATVNGKERVEYLVAAFDYNSADISRQNQAALREIAANVLSGATITVTGYTDRIGTEEYNQSLSKQRAERVMNALRSMLESRGVANVTIESAGAGSETTRFANDLPDGRMFSRSVAVVVEQGGDNSGDHP